MNSMDPKKPLPLTEMMVQREQNSRLLSEIGERAFIDQHILPLLSKDFGNVLLDDCAILDLGSGRPLLLSTDQGPRKTFLELLGVGTPADIGHFHVTASISDIAAMGGKPLGILLVLSLKADDPEDYVREFLVGVSEALAEYDTRLLGGDTKQALIRTTTITAIGRAHESGILFRKGAVPGDQIFVTPGLIGSTLADYVQAARAKNDRLSTRLLRPTAQILFAHTLATSQIVTSCMDMSDGIISSASQLGQLNGVSYELNVGSIPLAASPSPDREQDWQNLVLNVGGDFGLMFTTSLADGKTAEKLGGQWVGEVVASKLGDVAFTNAGASRLDVMPWEQFKTTGSISNALLSFV